MTKTNTPQYNIGSSAGNIIGPLLFSSNDAPEYKPGLTKTMGITCALLAVIGLQAANIFLLNRLQSSRRVKVGKPAKIRDLSMEHKYSSGNSSDNVEGGVVLGENAFKDLTDSKNDEFVYVY